LVVALLWLFAGPVVTAQPGEITVCLAGSPTCDYGTIQEAVDAAGVGDLIKVASGVYTGVQARPVPPGYLNPPPGALVDQVVYLTKTLAIQGGYTTTNWLAPDPGANPTVIDAQDQGRALLVAGAINPTVQGLRFTGGDASGQGGYSGTNWDPHDTGGGVLIVAATATFSDNVVFGNTAGAFGSGGGMFVLDSSATLMNNTVTTNTANTLYGGGLYLLDSDAPLDGNAFSGNSAGWGGAIFLEFSSSPLTGNTFAGNTVSRAGGALNVHQSPAIISGNDFIGNTALYGGAMRLYLSVATLTANNISGNESSDYGGGLHLWFSAATLSGNTILDNTAGGDGGAFELWGSNATFASNTIISNTAGGNGGAFDLLQSDPSLTNNVIAENQAPGDGDGLYLDNSSPNLAHNTIAANGGAGGEGVHVAIGSTAAMANTLLVGHGTGIHVVSGSAATLEATLWGNDTDWSGDGTVVTGTINVWGDPAFVGPGMGDYHIGPGSAALDQGVDAGVATDIDGQPRPIGTGYDIGADEFPAALGVFKRAVPNPVRTGSPLTFTLYVTNTGLLPLSATITDILPAQVTPTGTFTWTPPPILPDEIWTKTIVVTVESGYVGFLTNVVQVTTIEGATGAYTSSVVVEAPIAGLEAVNDSPTPLGSSTTLTATITVGSNVTYTWAFGDGTAGSGAEVTHTYPDAAVYTAIVTASNPVSELTATTTITIAATGPSFAAYLPLVLRNP
jgi:uncharacterized repeat protein (TIGR01451 family)